MRGSHNLDQQQGGKDMEKDCWCLHEGKDSLIDSKKTMKQTSSSEWMINKLYFVLIDLSSLRSSFATKLDIDIHFPSFAHQLTLSVQHQHNLSRNAYYCTH